MYATKLAAQILGRRVVNIDADCARLNSELTDLVDKTAPSLVALHGVGTHTAALLLVAAGDNAGRIRSEAAFAHLCGVAPIHASSGKVTVTGSTAAATGKPTSGGRVRDVFA